MLVSQPAIAKIAVFEFSSKRVPESIMVDSSRSFLKKPETWVAIVFGGFGMYFAATGPLSPETQKKFPQVVNEAIEILFRYRTYILVFVIFVLGYWIRSALLRLARLAREWLYIRPLALLLTPVVKRIHENSGVPLTIHAEATCNPEPMRIPASASAPALQPINGWVIHGNWQTPQTNLANWEFGPDWLRGQTEGIVLWLGRLPRSCRITFLARILRTSETDEIDTIIGDAMVLFFNGGVRLDFMTNDLQRIRNQQLIAGTRPRINEWHHFEIQKKGNESSFIIDGQRRMAFHSNNSTAPNFRDRLGFAHWRSPVEFKELRIEDCT